MNKNVKKMLRTIQTSFPGLVDTKFALMRQYRNRFGIPFDKDFNAIDLFPDADEALFLDVGANRGQSTDAILMKRKNCRIQLFEPNPLLFDKLERQYCGRKELVINRFGLGDRTIDHLLYVPFYKRWMFDGLGSFDADNAKEWLQRDRLFFFKHEYLSLAEVKCQIKRLDDLALDPFFIKLDVQGYEYQAIQGGERTIKSNEPILLIESPPKNVLVEHLEEIGYRMFAFKEGAFFAGVAGRRNTFFMTERKSALVKEYIREAGTQNVARRGNCSGVS